MKKIVLIMLLSLGVLGYSQSFTNAKEIKIVESLISLGKKYTVYADGKEIGTVQGKYFKMMGDVFTLYDSAGNEVLAEKQIKRSFNLSLDRLAIIYDPVTEDIKGYIGEETIQDFFSIFTKFHFYNSNQKDIGYRII